MRRLSPASSWSTLSTGIAAMVVQLGLATIPFRAWAMACGLTSLTTSGTSGSIRKPEELSMTSTPAAANRGAWALEVVAPAEKIATSRPVGSASEASSTTMSVPRNGSTDPAERAEAKKRIWATGKSRSSRRRRTTAPTWPVAPTTPMRIPALIVRSPRARVPRRRSRVRRRCGRRGRRR